MHVVESLPKCPSLPGALRAQLASQREVEMAKLREIHGGEIQVLRRELQEMMSQRRSEVCDLRVGDWEKL